MARPAHHGPTTVFRFRFRQADAERLQRIKEATSSKTDADALRHALTVADARLKGTTSVTRDKEPGAAHSGPTSNSSASSAEAAPAPHGRNCPKCRTPWPQHPIGACRT